MSDTISSPAVPATLTERELWARFIDTEVPQPDPFSNARHTYIPDYTVRYPGYSDIMDNVAEFIADCILDSCETENDIRLLIKDAEDYLGTLRDVVRDFHSFKSAHFIAPNLPDEPGEDASDEENRAWADACKEAERNPSFREPVASIGEAA